MIHTALQLTPLGVGCRAAYAPAREKGVQIGGVLGAMQKRRVSGVVALQAGELGQADPKGQQSQPVKGGFAAWLDP